jgi:hypothetical protein
MLPRHYWSLIILVGLHPFGARLLAASVSSHCSCRGTVVLVRLKHQPSLVINSVESVETAQQDLRSVPKQGIGDLQEAQLAHSNSLGLRRGKVWPKPSVRFPNHDEHVYRTGQEPF